MCIGDLAHKFDNVASAFGMISSVFCLLGVHALLQCGDLPSESGSVLVAVREVTETDVKHAVRLGRPPMPANLRKRRVTMMLDPDIIDRPKADGRGWQMREVLEL